MIEPATTYSLERRHSYSRVAVYDEQLSLPDHWGRRPFAPTTSVSQRHVNIDGSAATVMGKFNSTRDIDHLRYYVSNIGYYIAPRGKALIIGVGAGKDVQSAILFGQEHVVGVEINPILV